jgi:hypothetical protein
MHLNVLLLRLQFTVIIQLIHQIQLLVSSSETQSPIHFEMILSIPMTLLLFECLLRGSKGVDVDRAKGKKMRIFDYVQTSYVLYITLQRTSIKSCTYLFSLKTYMLCNLSNFNLIYYFKLTMFIYH